MPICEVPNCYRKRLALHKFPQNERKRKIWAKIIDRPNWNPTDTSVLCEAHFSEDAWEKIDGEKKLKPSALPTLFLGKPSKPPKTEKQEKKNVLVTPIEDEEEIVILDPESEEIPLFDPESEEIFDPDSEDIPFFDPHDYAMASVTKEVAKEEDLDSESIIIEILEEKETEEPPKIEEPLQIAEPQLEYEEIEEPQLEYEEIEELEYEELEDEKIFPLKRNLKEETKGLQNEEILQHTERIFNDFERARINLKRRVLSLRNKLKLLEESRDESKLLLRIQTLFNEDQLLHLVRDGKNRITWSIETMEKALKLRLACGEAGYTELLRQNFPLPSTRSLKRALKDSRFGKTFSEEVKYLQNEFGSEKGKAEDVFTTLRQKRGRRSRFDEFLGS